MAAEKSALHVDDDPLILKLVRSILGHAGYDVVSASNIGEAMRALEASPPSMILLDVEIGLESGYDLCNLIREAGIRTPLAFLTASPTLEHLKKAQDVGADYLIRKPFTPSSLLEGIERAVAARQKISQTS
jgi:DNA-binding response OmpR family regulator